MSSPKFMVFKLKDLKIPALIFAVIVALLVVLFYRNKTASTFMSAATPSPAPSSTNSSLLDQFADGRYSSKVSYTPGGTMNVLVDIRSNVITSVSVEHLAYPNRELADTIEKNLESLNNYVLTAQSIEFDPSYTPNNIELLLMDGVNNALSTELLPDLHYTYEEINSTEPEAEQYDVSELFAS